MKSTRALLALGGCLAGLLAGSLAAAQADSGTSQGTTGSTGATGTIGVVAATITTNGSGTTTLAAGASANQISSAYMSALSAALTDARTKAAALSSDSGDVLGSVQNIAEQSNDDGLCSSPMFRAATSAPAAGPAKKHKVHRRHHESPRARAADVVMPSSCAVGADVTVTYAMSAA
jgi:Protein of unknown function (DUF541)